MPVITSYYAGRLTFDKHSSSYNSHVWMNRYLLLYSIAALSAVLFFALLISPIVFGQKYDNLISLLIILSPCIILTAILSSMILQVQYRENAACIFRANLNAAITNIVLSIGMIYYWGTIGAALSTLIASFVPIFYLYRSSINSNKLFVPISFPLTCEPSS